MKADISVCHSEKVNGYFSISKPSRFFWLSRDFLDRPPFLNLHGGHTESGGEQIARLLGSEFD
jgi:hypothetical protein